MTDGAEPVAWLATMRTILASIAAAAAVTGLAPAAASAAPTPIMSPTVTGTAVFGNTLTCRNGTWSAGAGSFSYAWQYADGNVPIAKSQTLKVTDQMVMLGIDCVVTATDSSGAPASITSAPVTPQPATPTVKLARATVTASRKVRIFGTIAPTASFGPGGASLTMYRRTGLGLEQITFTGPQSHPPRNGRFTMTASHEPAGRNTYVIEYDPSALGYVSQVLVTRTVRVR